MTDNLIAEQNDVTRKCLVCGDKASGINFNGLTCQSCKIFFRRHAFKQKIFKCELMKNCEIDLATRNCCQKCRLEKCFNIGMKKELLNKYRKHPKPDSDISDSEEQSSSSSGPSDSSIDHPLNLQLHEKRLFDEVQNAMSVYSDVSKLTIVDEGKSMIDAFNASAKCIQKVIRFCKCFDGFNRLPNEDQLVLLKAIFSKAQSVRFAFVYDVEKDGAIVENYEQENTGTFISMSSMDEWKNLQTFYRRFLYSLKVEMENDAAIKNLISAYLLFTPQENVTCSEWIRYQHHVYSRLLQRYLEQKYHDQQKAKTKYTELMQILTQLVYTKQTCKEIFHGLLSAKLSDICNEIYGL